MTVSLDQLLARSAARDPDAPALRSPDGELTYGELDRRADLVARALLERGVRRQDRVGLDLRRGFDCVAAIFGILRAGAAYVPLDPTASAAAVAGVLRSADVRCLVSEAGRADRVAAVLDQPTPVAHVVGIDGGGRLPVPTTGWDELYAAHAARPGTGVIEQDLAVMFFTSGTTGQPKGVVHSHRSMLSNIEWALDRFRVVPSDRVTNVTSHHFELSWLELFVTIAAGATLVQVAEETVKFPASLAAAAERAQPTIWCSVPSVLVGLVQRGDLDRRDLAALRWVLFAGERFGVGHLRRLMELLPGARFCNMLGTTETHIAAHYEIPPLPKGPPDPLPIGSACAHVDLAVVDADGQPVPPGDTGELVIRGPSLMEGYWQRPEQTERALRPVAFTPLGPQRCYHTGDLVVERADGNLEILGRADRRVKVRGQLLDLDLVEHALVAHDRVQEAAAFVAGAEGDDAHVAAVVVGVPGATLDRAELRAHLSEALPRHALPTTIAFEPMLPKTGSGKVDRRTVQEAFAGSTTPSQPGIDPAPGTDPVRAFVEHECDVAGDELRDDTDLLASGLLNSLGVLRLVGFVEERFGVRVPNDELNEANFRSVDTVRALLERLGR